MSALLAGLPLVHAADSPDRTVCFALVVSAYAHVAHSLVRPFVDRAAYYLQHASLGVTTLVFAMGLLFKVNGFQTENVSEDSSSAGIVNSLGIVLITLCVAFLGVAALLACRETARNIRRSKLGKSAVGRRLASVLSKRGVPLSERWGTVRSAVLKSKMKRGRDGRDADAVGDAVGHVEMKENPMRRVVALGAGGGAGNDVVGRAGAASAPAAARKDMFDAGSELSASFTGPMGSMGRLRINPLAARCAIEAKQGHSAVPP